MMFPSVCAQAFLTLALSSFVVGDVISAGDQLPDLSGIPSDVTVEVGEPEYIKSAKLAVREAVGLEGNSLLARALSNDENEAFRLHNQARATKNIPSLTWDDNLANNARVWAQELARRGKMEHSSGDQRPNQGENLAFAGSSGTLPNPITLAAKMWVNEEPNYHGEIIPQGDFGKYGHYTQIVWKSTTKVGIATASDGKGGWYTVARYSPPGNWVGQKPF